MPGDKTGQPDLAHAQALIDRGVAAGNAGHWQTTSQCMQEALRIVGDLPGILRNLVRARAHLNDTDEALAVARRLLALDPDTAEPENWALLGTALAINGELAEALSAMRRCDALLGGRPHPKNTVNMADLLLRMGRWEEGLRLYEQRWAVADAVSLAIRDHLSALPRWDPAAPEPADLIIGGEQGSGDMLMIARFLPDIARRARRVTVMTVAPLLPLLAHSFADVPNLDLVPHARIDLTGYSHHLMSMSIPLALAIQPDGIPGRSSYLTAKDLGRTFRHSKARPAIAFAWQGAPGHVEDRLRSLPSSLVGAFISRSPHIDFHAASPPSMSPWSGPRPANLHYPLAEEGGFVAAAAMLAEMDLTISVDSAPCHLAGALGKPVWTLLRRHPDWRWGATPAGPSPWYASMTLVRQSTPGDWDSLLDDVTARLARFG